jgi:TRAP transporter 4TM/12TM fusion protein
MRHIAIFFGVCGALFHVSGLNIYPLDPLILRSIYLFVTLLITFIEWPARKKSQEKVQMTDIVFILLSAIVCAYTVIDYEGLIERAGVLPTRMDVIIGIILIVIILEMARRTMGPALPILGLCLIVYALWGQYFPGMFKHPGFQLDRVVSFVYSNDGIFGTPVAVTVTYVFVFVMFGSFMEVCGGGAVLMDLAMSLAGRSKGGAAKIAVVSSSFFGSLNGSPVANVTATGTFTIPLMKKNGYDPGFAGATEAAASTGGQILPPIMGASVFIMMEILGLPYVAVAKAAIIPAILYYVGVFWMVDLEATRNGLHGLPPDQVPKIGKVIKNGGYLLVPILVLVYMLLVAQVSPLRAGLWGTVSCLILSSIKKKSRFNIKMVIEALYVTMKGSVMVIAACAVAGAIVGILGLTGLGLNMANIIISYSKGILPLTLILATIVTMILGIGMPTTGSYIIGATIIAPALVQLDVFPLAAHLFVLYFANLSNITPPVALAGYAASGISGSNPLEVGVKAFKLGLAGFLVPFAWVYGPQLIMEGRPISIIFSSVTALIGVLSLGASVQGYIASRQLSWVSRVLLAVSAIMLVIPEGITDAVALGLIIITLFMIWKRPA